MGKPVFIEDIVDITYETLPEHRRKDLIISRFRETGRLKVNPGERVMLILSDVMHSIDTSLIWELGPVVHWWTGEFKDGPRTILVLSNNHSKGNMLLTKDRVIGYTE